MFKKSFFLFIFIWIAGNIFANNIINATIEINGVIVNGGLVYAAVYSNEKDYKDETAFVSFTIQPNNTALTYSLELPEGEYVVSVFQDTNGNGKLDKTIFWIPTEPVGITNYNRRGVPGGFQSLKVSVNSSSAKLIVNMGRVRALGVI